VNLHRKVLASLLVQPAGKIHGTLILEITSEGLKSLHCAAKLLQEDQHRYKAGARNSDFRHLNVDEHACPVLVFEEVRV